MVVWQFATIAALIGALLIYVMVLTNRLGTTNALLKRIEEGLVRPQPVTENTPVAAEVTAVPPSVEVAPEEEAPAAEIPERDRRVSYLTVRDLKVIARSGRRSTDIPAEVSPLFNEVFGRKHGQTELAEQPAEQPVETHEAVLEELAVATCEIRDFLETTPAPNVAVVEQEPVGFEPAAAAEPLAASYESAVCEPAVVPNGTAAACEPEVASHSAANEDQPPAEAPAATAAAPEPDDAAAREEKRKRELMMHSYRRRRSR